MIDWLLQSSADLPKNKEWLSRDEKTRLATFTSSKRNKEWLLGRWTAKRLVQATSQAASPLATISVGNDPDGVPVVSLAASGAEPAPLLSISHSHEWAFCGLIWNQRSLLGVDIERIEPRSNQFRLDYLTLTEQKLIENAVDQQHAEQLLTTVWSGKEAALKALGLGLSVDARAVSCDVTAGRSNGWQSMGINLNSKLLAAGQKPWPGPPPELQGWWRIQDNFVLTMVAGRSRALQDQRLPDQ